MQDRQEQLKEQMDLEVARIESKKEASKDIKSEMMSKDINTDSIKEIEKEVDPFLEEALKMGFDPKFEGPNKKSAEQFVKDGSFFKKISELKKDNEEVKKMVRQLAEHNTKLEKATYEKALNDLQNAKMRAVAEADTQKVTRIEAEQKVVMDKIQNVQVQETPKLQITQELLDFQERNKDWFNNQSEENVEMVEAADYIDKRIANQAKQKGITISQSEHLKLVEEKIKKLYGHRFSNLEQERKPIIASSTTNININNKDLASKLTKQQKEFVKNARLYGSKLTEEAYAKQLKVTGDLKDE